MVATLRYIDARTAVDIIVLIAEVLILENDAHIAILKNVNNTLRFEDEGLPGGSRHILNVFLNFIMILWWKWKGFDSFL